MKPKSWNKILLLAATIGMLGGCASTTSQAHFERNKDKSLSALLGQEEPSEAQKAETRAQLLESAKAYLISEEYDLAQKNAQKVLATDPENFDAQFVLAEAMLVRDPKAALDMYTALHSIRATSETLQGIGLAQVGSGQIEAGRETLNQVAAMAPELWRTHNGIGVSYAIQEDWSMAETSYKQAIHLKPENADLYSNLAKIYIQQKKYEEALSVFDGTKGKVIGNSKFNLTYRWALALNDQMDRAMHGLNEEQSAMLMNNLGQSALLERDLPRAISYFKSALNAHPSYYPDADQNLKLALRQMKMP